MKYFLLLVVMYFSLVGSVQAHPLAPALLQLTETVPTQYDVLWRTSATRVQSVDVTPVLPSDCRETKPLQASTAENESLTARWSVQCDTQGLVGKTIRIAGLERGHINVILRIELGKGETIKALLGPDQTSFIVPLPTAAPPVFSRYLLLGIEHLLTGLDHLLFVSGLLLLVRRLRPILITVTAFTLGHSITLALASLGLIHINSALAELGIALSILVLATEVVRDAAHRSWLSRRPWLMAASFGLLHGLGFAGALAEIGLPQGEIPLALFGFNFGIEIGHLLWVSALLIAAALWQRLPLRAPPRVRHIATQLPPYVIGSLAAYWCFERTATLFS